MARRARIRPLFLGVAALACVVVGEPIGAAEQKEGDTALKVPRFVSLHSDKVNLRTGPGDRYPIEWVLTRKEMPVEITAQFEHWRRIRDWEGTAGWVHERMVTGKRAVIVKGGVRPLYREPDSAASLVARAEPGVVARVLECKGAWCRIETGDVTGWIRRADVWGVYAEESVP
jgi:SH3-like domain-containing protein